MTTYIEARDELAAALTTAGVIARPRMAGDPPFAAVLSEGSDDTTHLARAAVPWAYRVRLVAGAWDQDAALDTLATMRDAAIATVRELAGWRLDRVTRDGLGELAGGAVWVADLYATRHIDIT